MRLGSYLEVIENLTPAEIISMNRLNNIYNNNYSDYNEDSIVDDGEVHFIDELPGW